MDHRNAGDAVDNTNYSLWVSGLASPFISWGERLEEILNADLMGDSEARQGAQNKTGELWSPISGDVPDWQAIMNRREAYPPIAPTPSPEAPAMAIFFRTPDWMLFTFLLVSSTIQRSSRT